MIVVVFLIIVIVVVVFIKNRSNRSIYDDRCSTGTVSEDEKGSR